MKKTSALNKSALNTTAHTTKGEITMKKTSIRSKIIAAVLAAVTICSVSTMAMTTTAFAAGIETTATFEKNMKKLGVDTIDGAFQAIGDLVPGGKFLVSPFKSILHIAGDGENPMDAISRKLDNVDHKLDQLSAKLESLNDTINQNTQWMAEKVQNAADLSDIRSDFKSLSAQAAKFVKDVSAAETNKNLNKAQKIMRLAALTDTARYDSLTTSVYNIMKAMNGSNPSYVDMFKTLYTKSALNKMFAREAYKECLPTVQALMSQYIYAVMLMQECQTASKAVAKFTEKDIASLGTYERNLYNSFDQYRHSLDNNDPIEALVIAVKGMQSFKEKYDRPAFINKNAATQGKLIRFVHKEGYEYVWNKGQSDHLNITETTKNNALTTAELTTIANYVRDNMKDKSLYDFLVGDMGIQSNIDRNCYIIVGNDISVSKTRNKSIDKSFNDFYDCHGYDRVGTIKAIRMDDKDKKVTDLRLYNYQTWDDEWADWLMGTYYDVSTSTANIEYVKMVQITNA